MHPLITLSHGIYGGNIVSPTSPAAAAPSPMEAINIHNLPMPEVDQCVICLETLDTKPTYSLPECNHTFHQNCIAKRNLRD